MEDAADARKPGGVLSRVLASAIALAPILATSGAAIAPAQYAWAQDAQAPTTGVANLNISPRRVIFTPRERSAAVYIFNQGTAPLIVDVALVDNVMLPNGEIIPLAEAERRGGEAQEYAKRVSLAKDAIIVTPSRLTLPAGSGRTVRLRAQMPEGAGAEVRTHLTVTSIPPPNAGLTAEQASDLRDGELQFSIQTIFGVSIPLFIREGDSTVSASFGAITFDQDPPSEALPNGQAVLVVPVQREGARSIFGNVEVRSGTGRDAELIGAARGIGVYTELNERVVRVPLQRRPNAGETLSVTFVDGEGGPSQALATGTAKMP